MLETDADRLDLLRAIDQFVRDTGITESKFGRDAAGDPRLIYDLRRGRTPRHKTRLRVLHYINRAYIDRAAASREGR
ncbi:hypothetical protein KFK14_19645 [Sphingobium phenoxybenzoativorans]|uniref:Uncharacterized protein n=1 Tax=Sphingobium phenoxybenzoativorans TaxID=1592790 RepID=A0A975KCJ6_9SPHN|nr:hypothetical protein KFK14_19645 [Sphingobium phenoxybenzoativorans]